MRLLSVKGNPTVLDILNRGTARLRESRLEQPRLLCECLVSGIIGSGRLELYMRGTETPGRARTHRIEAGIDRLRAGEPLQYVLRSADFMGRSFKVNRNCLIPRPETEELVELVAAFGPLWNRERPVVADVGTGCGCIAVTLALERPEGRYIAVDVSEKALVLARSNARVHGASGRIRFRAADVLARTAAGSLDAVVSNPPYVRTADWKRLAVQVREHEPRMALDGGEHGLDMIAPLIEQAFRALKERGFLFMEMGVDQWPDVRSLLRGAGFGEYDVKRDLSGRNRFVRAGKHSPD